MTLLPVVREQIGLAATRRAHARRRGPIVASLARRPQISLGAAAAALALSLALALGSWPAGGRRPGRAPATQLGAVETFTPPAPAHLRAATGLRWDLHLSETLP
jgi:hypothetical protein